MNFSPRSSCALHSLSVRLLAFFFLAGVASSAAALDSTRYYPLKAGYQWTYKSTSTGFTQTSTVGTPVSLSTGVLAFPVAAVTSDPAAAGYQQTNYETSDQNGFRAHQITSSSANSTFTITWSPPITYLPPNPVVGSTYTYSGTFFDNSTYQGTAFNSTYSYSIKSQIAGFETVSNYDGTQTWPALKVIFAYTIQSNSAGSSPVTGTSLDWYVDGVGLIQSVSPNGSGGIETWKLSSTNVVPFTAAVTSSITATAATVATKITFNPPDVGKSGAVFITAIAPSGSLAPVQSSLSALGIPGESAIRAYSTASSALTATSQLVLFQLTSFGWQQVVNGQLLPYASGVLGDQLSAQNILNNTDPTNLKGARFCLGYGTSADEMVSAARMITVATIPDPSAAGTSAASCIVINTVVDIRSYIPAAVASSNYQGYLRVINTGTTPTSVRVAVIDGATGAVGAFGQLVASLPGGAAVTFSAQQVETALGQALPASSRPRIRVASSASTIEVQSFMSNPGGVVTQVSDALTADSGYAVRNYVPAANAPAGYTSYIRVINVGTTASPIKATLIDDATGAAGVSGQLIASLPAGAAVTFTAQQVEAALGVSVNASSRPRISVASSSVPPVPMEVQSFIANPGGAVTQIGGASSGIAVVVRSYIPAASAASGYTGFVRVINTGTNATPISVSLLDGATGQASASGQLVASLPAGAAKTFSAQQVETALGLTLPASARPRIQVSANVSVDVQSFMSNPGGTVTQLSGAQSGTSVDVRTYIPAANASGGYASFIRVINTGTTVTPVNVAVIDGAAGAVGTSGQLTASLPAGAAVTFTAQQVETALGQAIAAGDRPRIRVTALASTIEVQSFMSNPGGVITETVDFQ
jgi:hypothetical protein